MLENNKRSQKNIFLVFIVIIVIIFTLHNFNGNGDRSIKKVFPSVDLSLATQMTCTYPQILNTSYISGEVSHNLPKPEKNAMIFTFTNIQDPQIGQLSYIDSTQTITNVPIVKLREDEDKIIYLDGNGENYLSIHTLYKKQGVSTYTKSVSLFGIPSGSLAMGTCVGY